MFKKTAQLVRDGFPYYSKYEIWPKIKKLWTIPLSYLGGKISKDKLFSFYIWSMLDMKYISSIIMVSSKSAECLLRSDPHFSRLLSWIASPESVQCRCPSSRRCRRASPSPRYLSCHCTDSLSLSTCDYGQYFFQCFAGLQQTNKKEGGSGRQVTDE